MHSHPEKYTKPANLSYKIMQLRSGTVLSSPATSRRANTNTRDPDYVVSKVELAKFKVREQVRERQRKIAEPHVNKAVENFAGMMQVMINEFHDIENETNVDPFMNKIRMITTMFAYAICDQVVSSADVLANRDLLISKQPSVDVLDHPLDEVYENGDYEHCHKFVDTSATTAGT